MAAHTFRIKGRGFAHDHGEPADRMATGHARRAAAVSRKGWGTAPVDRRRPSLVRRSVTAPTRGSRRTCPGAHSSRTGAAGCAAAGIPESAAAHPRRPHSGVVSSAAGRRASRADDGCRRPDVMGAVPDGAAPVRRVTVERRRAPGGFFGGRGPGDVAEKPHLARLRALPRGPSRVCRPRPECRGGRWPSWRTAVGAPRVGARPSVRVRRGPVGAPLGPGVVSPHGTGQRRPTVRQLTHGARRTTDEGEPASIPVK